MEPLDLEALSTIETETVIVGGQSVTMTMLVPEDIEKCRKLVKRKMLNEEMVMEYMTFLAMKKVHAEVSWYTFQKMNFKNINKLMAVMARQNGFDETFRAFTDDGRTGRSGNSGTGETEDTEELDF